MKILAISDTHLRKKWEMNNFLSEVNNYVQFDLLVHAGDFETIEVYNALTEFCNKNGINLLAVKGNCDNFSLPEVVSGWNVGVKHEPLMDDFTDIYYLARELDVKVMVFGHLHRFIVASKKPLIFCPGYAKLGQFAYLDKKLRFFLRGEEVESEDFEY